MITIGYELLIEIHQNNLKKQFPLWKNTRYQNEVLNFKQKMDLLETIFNADDLAIHLKYPYD